MSPSLWFFRQVTFLQDHLSINQRGQYCDIVCLGFNFYFVYLFIICAPVRNSTQFFFVSLFAKTNRKPETYYSCAGKGTTNGH